MRIGLIATLRACEDSRPRASLMLAGRSVLAWQAGVLQTLGVERALCLTGAASDDVIAVQQRLEASGIAFHALTGFAALPALVRAEDDLVIIADGLVPDAATASAVLGEGEGLRRAVLAIPADDPLAVAHPEDFERIDAARHWAGVLVMRGAPVQQLADFPPDADAISLLLRLALQTGTPCHDLRAEGAVPEQWLLADSAAAVAAAQQALIASAGAPAGGGGPVATLAGKLVRTLAPRGLAQGALVAGSAALVLLLAGVMAAAFGPAAAGLGLASIGAFAAQIALAYGALSAGLEGRAADPRGGALLSGATDGLAAAALWFALVPWPAWEPLAVLGPLTIGLARVVGSGTPPAFLVAISERASLLLVLALAALLGLLPEALACTALGLVSALLLHRRPT
ncbi:MAG: hypothetical protein MUF47_11970, partial [Porphyrobacter sp.]|nr:hypothetical protein [Porphyrobacter sp.]